MVVPDHRRLMWFASLIVTYFRRARHFSWTFKFK